MRGQRTPETRDGADTPTGPALRWMSQGKEGVVGSKTTRLDVHNGPPDPVNCGRSHGTGCCRCKTEAVRRPCP